MFLNVLSSTMRWSYFLTRELEKCAITPIKVVHWFIRYESLIVEFLLDFADLGLDDFLRPFHVTKSSFRPFGALLVGEN